MTVLRFSFAFESYWRYSNIPREVVSAFMSYLYQSLLNCYCVLSITSRYKKSSKSRVFNSGFIPLYLLILPQKWVQCQPQTRWNS